VEPIMSQTLTLEVPEVLALSARAVASRTGRRVEDVLADWLRRGVLGGAIEQLPDEEILALRDLQLTDEQQTSLDDLLAQQREGTITDQGRAELDSLLEIYRQGMVYKSRALKAAVDRGLQPPLGPEQ
jgi:hypothetical protein